MELSSGSLVGSYPDEDMALLVVLETIRQSGEKAAATLALGYDDPSGETDGRRIAEGATLRELAYQRFGNAPASRRPAAA